MAATGCLEPGSFAVAVEGIVDTHMAATFATSMSAASMTAGLTGIGETGIAGLMTAGLTSGQIAGTRGGDSMATTVAVANLLHNQ
jgi:hypothetical protein